MGNKYELSPAGIDRYFIKAYKSMFNKVGKQKKVDSFFLGVNETNKDYHILLKSYMDSKVDVELKGKKLWEQRLHHVCNALNFCAKKLNGTRDIELGIFGSNDISSDIDIGVSYKKNTDIQKKNLLKLSVVVKTFEDYFVNLGYTSIDLDVEMYADYFVSPYTGQPFIKMNKHIYERSLPFVVAGIIKNHIHAYYGRYKKCGDIRRNIKGFDDTGTYCYGTTIENVVNNFDIPQLSFITDIKKQDRTYIRDLIEEFRDVLPISKHIITDYVTMPYDIGRYKYYDLLDYTHTLFVVYFNNPNEYLLSILSTSINHALIYRAESYISSSTITHIVYKLQAKQNNKSITNLIGSYGYRLSIMEQYGYLSRYYYQYCKKKCSRGYDKKFRKYMDRLLDGLSRVRKGSRHKKIRINRTRRIF